MRIEVWIEGWEQGCCGTPFRIGDAISWDIHAAEPGVAGEPGLAVYREEHHGQTPDAVPHRHVRGVVRGIRAVSYPTVRDPVNDVRTADASRPSSREIDAVDSATSGAEFRVEFEVDDAEELPAYAPDPAAAEYAAQTEEDARRRARERGDELGAALAALADRLQLVYGPVARIDRSDDDSACSARPRVRDGASVRWARGAEGIRVRVGDGRWTLQRDVDAVSVIEGLVGAAAAGRVTESLETEGETILVVTAVDVDGGAPFVARTERGFGSLDGSAVLFGARRPPIGGRRYAPWR